MVLHSIVQALKYEKLRYQQKGFETFLGLTVFIAYFYIFPKFLLNNWEKFTNLTNKRSLFFYIDFGLSQVLLVLGNLVMYIIYTQKFSFLEKFRVLQESWPWEKDSQKWRLYVKKVLKQLFFNQYIVTLPFLFTELYLKGADNVRWDIESFPSIFEILWQFVFMMLIEDFGFYWVHRILHHPLLYKRIHKVHHEFTNTTILATTYNHPMETVITALPTAAGMVLLGKKCHYSTYIIWLTWRIVEGMDAHSGYAFPWSPFRIIPFQCQEDQHNYHHKYNEGTYGSFFNIWDTIFQTNKDFKIHEEQKLKKFDQIKKK